MKALVRCTDEIKAREEEKINKEREVTFGDIGKPLPFHLSSHHTNC